MDLEKLARNLIPYMQVPIAYRIPCPKCDGLGDVVWPSEDGGSPPMICPKCSGRGWIAHPDISHRIEYGRTERPEGS